MKIGFAKGASDAEDVAAQSGRIYVRTAMIGAVLDMEEYEDDVGYNSKWAHLMLVAYVNSREGAHIPEGKI